MKLLVNISCLMLFFVNSYGQELFEDGNKAYLDAKYEIASTKYEEAIIEDESNVSAYYNLGMTHVQLKEYGNAIWAFEKVLKLDPVDEMAEEQIIYAYSELGNVTEWQPVLGPIDRALFSITSKTWSVISIIACTIGSLFIIVYLLRREMISKRYLIIACLSFFAFTLVTGFIAYRADRFESKMSYGVITSGKINSFLDDNLKDKGPELQEGKRFTITSEDTLTKSVQITDENDNTYFVRSSDIKAI